MRILEAGLSAATRVAENQYPATHRFRRLDRTAGNGEGRMRKPSKAPLCADGVHGRRREGAP